MRASSRDRNPDTAPVRPGEELDQAALARVLATAIPEAARGVAVEQFPGGHSNLTYLLRIGGQEYVLRRPPPGPIPPKAHDMAREFRVLAAVSPRFSPAPKPLMFYEDSSIVGAPFYLMERRRGVIARRSVPPEFADRADFPRLASQAFADTLAKLHAIDIHAHALDSLGKSEGFLERQVRGWSQRWEKARTSETPEMEQVSDWLIARLPESPAPTLLHNDYKLDNIMFDAADPSRIVAVLDWEMATVGDPLVDLGVALSYWPEAEDPQARRDAISPLTTQPGWMSRAEILERYHRATGRNLEGIAYYEVFGVFKLAVVLEQIYHRWLHGQTRDERFRDFHGRVEGLARAAAELAEKSS